MTGDTAQSEDPAATVDHEKADSAHAGHSSLVRHSYGYFSAHVNPTGSLVHSGPKNGEEYQYTAPDGTRHARGWRRNKDGSPSGIIGSSVMSPAVNGEQHKTVTVINHTNHTYSRQHTEYPVTGGGNAPWWQALDLWSSPTEVQQALRSGEATQKGTTTVHGTPAIALSITVPHTRNLHRTLYVDAVSYQPLRTVTVADGNRIRTSRTGCRPHRTTSPRPRTTPFPPATRRSTRPTVRVER